MSLVGYSSSSESESESRAKPTILERMSSHVLQNPEIDDYEVDHPGTTGGEHGNIGGSIEKVYVERGALSSKRPFIKSSGNSKKKKQKRDKGNLDSVYLGPWASFDNVGESIPDDNESDNATARQKYEENEEENRNESEREEEEEEEEGKEDKEENRSSQRNEDKSNSTTEYLAKFRYPDGDFLSVPMRKTNLLKNPGIQECFVPKKVVKTLLGHENGVSKLEFFPKSGHLLLSGGNDSIIRLWDVYNRRELIREYYGHDQSIKDLMFNNAGDRFLSCSLDKRIHLWDTRSGDILNTLKTKSIPTALLFNPNNDNEFLVGLMTGKIEHYNISDLSKPIQTYDHHLSTINIIYPVQNGKRFLSASDDKSVRIWNWGINIPVKIITHPTQYAIASVVSVPPDDKQIAMQNMNNAIQVIDGDGKYKFKKKYFKNPNITGYKIEIHISPDGKILMSGDSKGNGMFWDWKSGKLIRQLKISNKMIHNIKFHPQEKSKVVAGGLDGKIYYCD